MSTFRELSIGQDAGRGECICFDLVNNPFEGGGEHTQETVPPAQSHSSEVLQTQISPRSQFPRQGHWKKINNRKKTNYDIIPFIFKGSHKNAPACATMTRTIMLVCEGVCNSIKGVCHEYAVDKFITFCGWCVNKAKHKHIPEDVAWVICQSVIRIHNINNTKDPVTFTRECVCI